MYEFLKEELQKDYDRLRERRKEWIYSDEISGAKAYATDLRWEQYQRKEISEEELKDYAYKRSEKQIEKDHEKKLGSLERIGQAPDLIGISIAVEYTKGGTATATCEIDTEGYFERKEGRAAGHGYDKESSAVAEALNQSDSVMKALYSYKEKRLEEGADDFSETACTGHDNRQIIAYGAGYTVLPYFEGGVGMNCFENIFNLMGWKMNANYTARQANFYHIYKTN